MNDSSRIIAALRENCSSIDACLARIYNIDMTRMHSGQRDVEAEERRARMEDEVGNRLTDLATRLTISLDMLGLRDTRAWFLARWQAFDEKSLKKVDFVSYEEMEDTRSIPYDLISITLSTLAAPHDFSDETVKHGAQLEVLENVLRATAKIVNTYAKATKMTIDREKPLRDIMHAYLANVFPDYAADEKSTKILKPIKSFVPDAVVHSLQAAIEFKFVDDEAELKIAYDGILTDLSAYGGSHWRHYYSVIYMTGPYETEARFKKAVELSGHAGRWTQIVVNGSGGRTKRGVKGAPEAPAVAPVAEAAQEPPPVAAVVGAAQEPPPVAPAAEELAESAER